MSVSNSSYRELTDISFTNVSSYFLIFSVQSFDLWIRTGREKNFFASTFLVSFLCLRQVFTKYSAVL